LTQDGSSVIVSDVARKSGGHQEDELQRRRKGHRMKVNIPRRLQQETIMTLQ